MSKDEIKQNSQKIDIQEADADSSPSTKEEKHHAKHATHKTHHEHHAAHKSDEVKSSGKGIERIVLYSIIGILVIVVCVTLFLLWNGKYVPSSNITEGVRNGKLSVVILNDARCKECDVSTLVPQLEQALGANLSVKNLDYSSAEGKKLYADSKLTALPAVLFNADVANSSGYSSVQRYLEPKGSYLSLRIGAAFDPTKEICDNQKDDDGNGQIDCADTYCAEQTMCRPEIKNDLKVFIMSDCPYGKEAIKALKQVVDNFKDSITYSVHYIASEDGNGYFNSLHGKYEADENIIQLCVAKYESKAVSLDYLYCRSVNGIRGIDWKTCAKSSGVNVDKIQACFDGDEGKQLLREDIKIADALGVGGSPTWLANNRYTFGGFDPESIKSNMCAYNSGLDGCENTLTSASTGPSGSCG